MSDTERIPKRSADSASLLKRPDNTSIHNLGRAMSKSRRISVWTERIRAAYFANPDKRLLVKKGEYILRQDHENDKLYYVQSGSFTCSIMIDAAAGERQKLELFRSKAGGFIGVRSFFADSRLAVFDAIADEDSIVMWMDRSAVAVDTDRYGSLREQFFPVIMKELEQRQFRLTRVAREGVSARMRMHKAEDMATLGQFAAGLAHELNNATSVLMSSSQHLDLQLAKYFRRYAPELLSWYEKGTRPEGSLSSAEVRAKARELAAKHRLDYETAKDLVRMNGGEDIRSLPGDTESLRDAWNTGRSCRDILSASKHAANIIHSIKQLSTGGHAKREPTDVGESIREALELLRDTLKNVDIQTRIGDDLPRIQGNTGELMQIWLNIVKNAYEALRDADVGHPRVAIAAEAEADGVRVEIADNGPGIPAAVMARMFQPNITTKTGDGEGNSMGLGLGLYIVKRLVDSYHGGIEVRNAPPETCFVVRLPLDGGPRGSGG